MGPREQSVASGSTITLRCVILSPYQTRPIRGVQWLRDNKLLTFQVTHTSSRETESNEIFFTSSLFFLSTINSRESLQRKKRDHKSSMLGRQPTVRRIFNPFLFKFQTLFFARIEFHFLPCGEALMRNREKYYSNKDIKKNRTFSPWKI